jgi:hypothetical protein
VPVGTGARGGALQAGLGGFRPGRLAGGGGMTYAGGTAKQQTAQTVANELRKQGLSENAIAGVMANIQSESSFDPTLRHADQPKFGGEAHFAHGLFQEGGDEWNQWAADMRKRGLDPNTAWKDPAEQARFVAGRLKGTIGDKQYADTFRAMQSGSKEEAAKAFVRGYLKPAQQYREGRAAQYGRGVPDVEHYTGPPTGQAKGPNVGKDGQALSDGGYGGKAVSGASLSGVNPRLVAAVRGGAGYLPEGYTVRPTSGFRGGVSQSYHSKGMASDWQIIDPQGNVIPNEGDDKTGMYTQLARGVKTWATKNDPDLEGHLGWGGAFGTKIGGGGVPDLMHFDLGGSRGRMVPERQFSRLKLLPDRVDQSIANGNGAAKAEGHVHVTVNSNGTAANTKAASAGDLWQTTTVQNYKQMQKTDSPPVAATP